MITVGAWRHRCRAGVPQSAIDGVPLLLEHAVLAVGGQVAAHAATVDEALEVVFETDAADLAQDHPDDYKKIKSLLQQRGDLDNRIQRWKNYTNATEYNKTSWRKAALIGNVEWDDMSPSERKIHTRRLKGKAHFDISKWAYFHRAALKQRSLVLGWIN